MAELTRLYRPDVATLVDKDAKALYEATFASEEKLKAEFDVCRRNYALAVKTANSASDFKTRSEFKKISEYFDRRKLAMIQLVGKEIVAEWEATELPQQSSTPTKKPISKKIQ